MASFGVVCCNSYSIMTKKNVSISESLQGPGEVNVTLMSSDGSWWGGEAVFEYIDDPLTNEEYLNKVVTNNDMRLELFKRMHKKMSSNKPSEGQTSDSSGKTGPGVCFFLL